MLTYLARRLGYMIILLWVISIVGFWLINLPPGTALDIKIQQIEAQGGTVSTQQIQALEQAYGLNLPLPERYLQWMGGVLHGNFGQSIVFGQPVASLLWSRIAFTLIIAITGLIMAWLVAVPIGVYSATHRYTMPDYVITALQFIGVAVPEFLLALILLVFAADVLGQHNIGGLFSAQYQNSPWSIGKIVDFLGHLWIPVVVIAITSTAWQSRVMRANMLDVLNYQYVQTARAKGVRESLVIWKHAVRNALHPMVMALGTQLPLLLSGELVVSIVLNLPSDGPLYYEALQNKDMYLAMAFLMVTAALLVLGNLLADLGLAWLDPRVRLE
ncbi:MAG TPA: ABC transporter permease [Candidatus Dormibacteraeota bacterium]|jgi:peptide/nickel transport system permease protein|nr:ABC transporter permease [Candidatus Dormibacteraeota bacterium]